MEFIVTKNNYVRTVSQIEGEWLKKLYPDIYNIDNPELNEESVEALKKIAH